MQIRITKPGVLSTIQDLGRPGYLAQAVPVSGAMDTLSHRLANLAVGNKETDATIEFTYGNIEFLAETDLLLAFSGSGATPSVNGYALPVNKPVFIASGSLVELKSNLSGCRTYMAIAGGFNVPELMGSKSTYLQAGMGGLNGRSLQKGDVLESLMYGKISIAILDSLNQQSATSFPSWSVALPAFQSFTSVIRVIPGREFTWFNGESLLNFMSETFKVSRRNNRMAYQLEGHNMQRLADNELLSTAVCPGTIQVTGDGKLMLLMADCQSTGGYPRIAQVAAVDLPLCAQLKSGDEISFEVISHKQAEKLHLRRELDIQQLKTSIIAKYSQNGAY